MPYIHDQWMEFTGRIEVRGNPNDAASRVELWVNGQLVIDYAFARINWGTSDGSGLGQFMLTPFHTNKDPNQAHPTGYTWYDDLIISTQPIPMVNGAIPTPDTTPPAISSIVVSSITSGAATITWTTNKPADTQVLYGPTSSYGFATPLKTRPSPIPTGHVPGDESFRESVGIVPKHDLSLFHPIQRRDE